MEIKDMTIEQIEERKQTIVNGLEDINDKTQLDSLEEEMRALNAEIEQRREQAARIADEARKVVEGAGETVKVEVPQEGNKMPEKRTITVADKEYRDAFYSFLANPTEETRAALTNVISVTGDSIAIPKSLDEKIWDNVHTAHPILADINVVRSGVVLEVTKHTAITAGKAAGKADNTDQAAEANTFVKVQLVGKDFAKYVELTYAEAKMSQGALEDYIAEEIGADISEAMAKEVFDSISTDAQAATAGATAFATVTALLGAASHAVNPVIYCNATNYYALMGAVDKNGQPIFRDGVAIGADVKIDSAATGYVCVDPKKFILNVVSDVTLESDKDVKKHTVVVSGYARAQGCMRDNLAASKVAALIAG